MKTTIARYVLTAVGFMGLAGTPALFAGDFYRDSRAIAHENAEIRGDGYRLRRDVEEGRYFRAGREREELNRDYRERGRELRDVRRDYRDRDWR